MAFLNNAALYTSAILGPATSLEELIENLNEYLTMDPEVRDRRSAERLAQRGLSFGDVIAMVAIKSKSCNVAVDFIPRVMLATADIISGMSDKERADMLATVKQETLAAIAANEALQNASLKAKETLSSK